jgi:hypothetical protein
MLPVADSPMLPCCARSYPTFRIQDQDAKLKAREEIVKGALADKLKLLTQLVVSVGSGVLQRLLQSRCKPSAASAGLAPSRMRARQQIVSCAPAVLPSHDAGRCHTTPPPLPPPPRHHHHRQEAKPGKYLTGDSITHGDLAVFCSLSTLQSGWLDGVPTDLLSSYPALKAFRNAIASLPEVAAFYRCAVSPRACL